MTRVIHVTTRDAWERARDGGAYGGELVERDGFLHLCTPAQLSGVLHRYFDGADPRGLIGLLADADALGDALRWESAPPSDERFPHLYRPLEVAEVVDVSPVDGLLAGEHPSDERGRR